MAVSEGYAEFCERLFKMTLRSTGWKHNWKSSPEMTAFGDALFSDPRCVIAISSRTAL